MHDKSNDRRYQRTQRLLERALIELLHTKNIYEISIPEITIAADISRATFYLHYKTPYELLTYMEDKILSEIVDAYKKHDILDQRDFLLKIYHFLYGNNDLMILLLNPSSGSNLGQKLSNAIKQEYDFLWAKKLEYLNEQERQYCGTFIIDGYIAVLKTWLKNGMKETPEEMVALSRRFQYKIR